MPGLALSNFTRPVRAPQLVQVTTINRRRLPEQFQRDAGDTEEIYIGMQPPGGSRSGKEIPYSFTPSLTIGSKAHTTLASATEVAGQEFESWGGKAEDDAQPSFYDWVKSNKYFNIQFVPTNRKKGNGEPVEALKFLGIITEAEFEEAAKQRARPVSGTDTAVASAPAQDFFPTLKRLIGSSGATKTDLNRRIMADKEAKALPGFLAAIMNGTLLQEAVKSNDLDFKDELYTVNEA